MRLVGALAAVAALAFAGCGGSDEKSDGGSTQAAQDSGPARAGVVAPGAFEGTKVSFVSWGGDVQEAQIGGGLGGWAETSGGEIVSDGPTDGAKIKAQVESGSVTWDVVDIADKWAAAHCGELLERIDYDIVDTSELMPGARATDCGVPAIVTGNVLAYNKDKYKSGAPTTWADFFDTRRFPGKRGIYAGNPSVTFEAALLADGVAPEDMYPLDVDRALKKLETIKDDIVFWDGGALVQQMMESGQIDMGLIWSGRVYGAVKAGAPWAVSHEQPYLTYDFLVIPKGTKNPEAANSLINYYIGARQQAAVTERITYPGVNKNARPNLGPMAAEFQVDRPPFNDQQYIDLDYWSRNIDALTDRWASWING
jgi:putative spermidine/putrescine transport system substrate-binding protein